MSSHSQTQYLNSTLCICIAIYNHAEYIEDCLRSIFDQKLPNISVIICDDKSTDNSLQVIGNLSKKWPITILSNKQNKGVSETFNHIYANAPECDYYMNLGSDDRLETGALQKMLTFMQQNQHVAAVTGGYHVIDENGNRSNSGPPAKYTPGPLDAYDWSLGQRELPHPWLMIRAAAHKEMRPIPSYLIFEDLYMVMWLVSEKQTIHCLDDITFSYRQHSSNNSSNHFKTGLAVLETCLEFYSSRIARNYLKCHYFYNKKKLVRFWINTANCFPALHNLSKKQLLHAASSLKASATK
ncbi:glycosyltransferase [Persicirhabdus sediminis]|uniref:Glycosyltransferase n=1 Tax=Persicirhabdus sediminis TaxID=454144 RepID=A0A8J7MET3_9BACT|nr:glycosyltransferase [Persicirhabdus sediminis]MBK1790519.1 glycosyltransferase [Persicirhabdus sediminis]